MEYLQPIYDLNTVARFHKNHIPFLSLLFEINNFVTLFRMTFKNIMMRPSVCRDYTSLNAH
jgi:hypothetical protein